MKQFQTVYQGTDAFRDAVSEWKTHSGSAPVLIHLFSDGADPADVTAACGIIDELMPEAVMSAPRHPAASLRAGYPVKSLSSPA